MKKFIYIVLLSTTIWTVHSCTKESTSTPIDEIPESIDKVDGVNFRFISGTSNAEVSWKNPKNEYLDRVEIIYREKDGTGNRTIKLLNVQPDVYTSHTFPIKEAKAYQVDLTAINKKGIRSETVSIDLKRDFVSPWVGRADTLMKAMVKLYLDGKPRDIWTSRYPQGDGYWDGAAVIWGHGGAFSGYTAFKEATWTLDTYKKKIADAYDIRLLNAIDLFRNTKGGGPEAYAVYPGDGDMRYYDDNIWVGIDMARLYILTKDSKYLDRAKIVWNFVLHGSDDIMGGGVYWVEGGKSKHTCSTFPAAVLGLTLFEATQESAYLEQSRKWYTWGKEILQDPADALFWDNARLADENDPSSEILIAKEKYSYNTGQPMQAAAKLYQITKEDKYLQDAQKMAQAAYKRWFTPFHSYALGDSFQILEPGHVWFQAIMMRGYMELYRIDGNSTYIEAYAKTLEHAWRSNARNKSTNLINENFTGSTTQDTWEVIHQGAILEMMSHLASLDVKSE